MPTIIAVDVSLSMCRPCGRSTKKVAEDDILTRKKLAGGAVSQFLGHLSSNCKLEYVSLVAFSHECEVIPFSRDFESLRSQFCLLSDRDRTNYGSLLRTIEAVVLEQYGTAIPVQILVVTDGRPGFGPGCLRSVVDSALRFTFPAKMNILALSDPEEKNYSENCQLLQQLIEETCGDGVVYFPDDFNSATGCAGAISKLCAKDFMPYRGTLRCGQLMSGITLSPAPQPFVDKYEGIRCEIAEVIDIVGFISNADLAGPSAHSRHLVLPCRSSDPDVPGLSQDSEMNVDTDSTVPNFCVLLHGAMKVEGYSAIVQVGENWFGYIVSWADSKKKSNLMLSLWPPGTDVIPWLGNLAEIGSKDELVNKLMAKYGPEGATVAPPAFPVKPAEIKSYSANSTIWSNASGINSDLQKLLRFARKLPEKTSQFYKELNRMRRWALTIGFPEILETINEILHREAIAPNVNPEAAMQLHHAMNQLRGKMSYTKLLTPHKP